MNHAISSHKKCRTIRYSNFLQTTKKGKEKQMRKKNGEGIGTKATMRSFWRKSSTLHFMARTLMHAFVKLEQPAKLTAVRCTFWANKGFRSPSHSHLQFDTSSRLRTRQFSSKLCNTGTITILLTGDVRLNSNLPLTMARN